MKTVKRLVGFLTLREKLLVTFSLLIRLGLVALDLAGIFLVGVVVSLISGTTIAETSPLAIGLAWLRSNGFENGYAVILGIAVGFFIVKGILAFVLTFLTANYVGRIEAAKARQAYEGLFHSRASDLDKFGKQDIMHGLTNSMNAAFGLTITIGAGIVGEIGLLVGVSVYLAIVNFPLFTMVALFFGAVGLIMQASVGKLAGIYAKRQHESFMKSQETILDSVSNFKQLAIGDSRPFVNQFGKFRSWSARSSAIYGTLGTLPRYITEISVMVGVGLLVLQRSVSSSSMSAATIAVFLAGIFRIVASMLPLQSGLSYFKRIEHEAELGFRMVEVFSPNSVLEKVSSSRPISSPEISVENLNFSYPGRSNNLLSNVSFKIPTGKYCAIVGASGTGKSTLIDLILGLYEPEKGFVRIDGLKPRDYITEFSGSVGYVPQTTSLISGTLLENITLQPGVDWVDQARLNSVIEMANLTSMVSDLPQGLNTKIGAEGINLSGGQSQRVGLARALYLQPTLLILDEATSALDDESEGVIQRALEKLRGDVTILVIAHRPATIRAADMVLNVNSNGVEFFGSYEQFSAN